MALTPLQQSSRLFKKSLGVAETITTKEFFSEAYLGKTSILPSQIWAEADLIPTTAPTGMDDNETRGVVQFHSGLSLTYITGSISGSSYVSYYNAILKDAIPFNFGDGSSYGYKLYTSTDVVISDGVGDWLVDGEAGVLTFYNTATMPAGVTNVLPPKITFYKYVGDKGLTFSGSTNGFNVHDAVKLTTNSGDTLINYSTFTSGYTTLPNSIDGVSGNTLIEGNRILVKNQSDARQNGLFQISGTTLVRAIDANGQLTNKVSVGDYVFTMSGTSNTYTGWVLSSTNGNPLKIVVGVDTQIWNFFSASESYTADDKALQLDGSQFKVVLDESNILGSGLEQNVGSGLRIQPALLSTIDSLTGTTSIISSLTTSISNEISIRTGADISLSTDISTTMSSEISTRSSADSSLATAINNKSGVTSATAGSGLTFDVPTQTLNVNVDNWTIKVISDQLRTPLIWIETDKTTVILSGTTGATNIVLDHEPVGQVSAYVNGIEYLVSTYSGTTLTDMPFFFDNFPALQGDTLKYSAIISGFGLNTSDLIMVKYHYIDITP